MGDSLQWRSVLKFAVYMAGAFAVISLANALTGDDSPGEPVDAQPADAELPQRSSYPDQVTPEIVAALQEGGHTIFIRHTKRDRIDTYRAFDRTALNDEIGVDPEFTVASCLNAQGRAEARLLGHVFRLLEIPVETVYSSPVCRAVETAELAFGRVDVVDPNLIYNGMKRREERAITNENLRSLLHRPPGPSTNKVITAHRGMLEEVGWENAQLEEGGMFVIKNIDAQNAEAVLAITLEDLVREALPISVSFE